MPEPPITPSGHREDQIFAAVEHFIELRQAGALGAVDDFLVKFPAELRTEIEAQCRAFLALDSVVGETPVDEAGVGDQRRVGDYVLEEEIGRGGMGVVYKARQISLDRVVALKVMSSGLAMSRRHVDRFRQEAAAAARVQHPGIVPIYTSGEIDGTLYTSMEFIAGHDLAWRIRAMRDEEQAGRAHRHLGVHDVGPYRAEVAECVAQIADALDAAHRAGIVHRDVKPSNVLIGLDGRARVVDFGLAKALDGASVSVSGELTGTPHYMSPEQTLAKRAPVDHRTDIFSLGVILYELLTLRRPFEGEDLQNVFYAICFADPPSIAGIDPSVPRDLITICEKSLEKDPKRRYASAKEMADDLRRFLRFKPIAARPASLATRAAKWMRRHRVLTTTVASTLLVLVAGGTWLAVHAEAKQRELAGLIASARESEGVGDLRGAIQGLTRAAALAPQDEQIRLRLDKLQSDLQRRASEVSRFLAESVSASYEDPDVALRLALASYERVRKDDASAKRRIASTLLTVLDRHVPSIDLPVDHWPMVHDACFTPDGKYVAVASALGAVEVYEIEEVLRGRHSPRFELGGHAGHVRFVRVSADGSVLASAGDDGSVRVFSLRDGRPLAVLTGVRAVPFDLALDADASHVAVVDRQGEAHVWDLGDNARVARFHADVGRTRRLSFLPERDLLICVSLGSGRRIDIRSLSGESVHTHDLGPVAAYPTILIDPRGEWYLFGTADGAQRHSSSTFELLAKYETLSRVRAFAVDASGRQIALACEDNTIGLWSTGRVERVHTFAGAVAPILSVGFRAAGERLLATAKDRKVYEWSVRDARVVRVHPSPVRLGPLVVDAARDRYITKGYDSPPRLWLPPERASIRRLPDQGSAITSAAIDAAGEVYVTGCKNKLVRLYELSTGRELFRQSVGRAVDEVAIGAEVFAARTLRGMRVWRRGAKRALWRHDQDVRAIDVSRDDAFVAVGDPGGTVRILRVEDGELVAALDRPTMIRHVRFSPDAALLAVGDHERTTVVFDWRAGTERARFVAPEGGLSMGLSWSPDGARVAVTRESGHVRVWDLALSSVTTELVGHGASVARLDFAPDGRRAVTASLDGTVRVWSLPSGVELVRHELHVGRPSNAFFVEGGERVWSGELVGTCMTWPSDPIAHVEAERIRPLRIAQRERYGLLRTQDVQARELVDALYDEHVLTADVQRELAGEASLDPALRALARRYALERPNLSGPQLWVRVYSAIFDTEKIPRAELDRFLVLARAAARINPTEPPALRTLAYVQYRRGEYEQAWQTLSLPHAHPERRFSPAVRGFRTLCLLQLGRTGDAREEFDGYCAQLASTKHAIAEQLFAEIRELEPSFKRANTAARK